MTDILITGADCVGSGRADLLVRNGVLADPATAGSDVERFDADGLIALQSGKLTINDWESLQEAGEFELNYLHLPRGAPAQPTV